MLDLVFERLGEGAESSLRVHQKLTLLWHDLLLGGRALSANLQVLALSHVKVNDHRMVTLIEESVSPAENVRVVVLDDAVALTLLDVLSVALEDKSRGTEVNVCAYGITDFNFHRLVAIEAFAVESHVEESRSERVQLSVVSELLKPVEDGILSISNNLVLQPGAEAAKSDAPFGRAVLSKYICGEFQLWHLLAENVQEFLELLIVDGVVVNEVEFLEDISDRAVEKLGNLAVFGQKSDSFGLGVNWFLHLTACGTRNNDVRASLKDALLLNISAHDAFLILVKSSAILISLQYGEAEVQVRSARQSALDTLIFLMNTNDNMSLLWQLESIEPLGNNVLVVRVVQVIVPDKPASDSEFVPVGDAADIK